ncbi:MAG TPA: hypothetical protein VJ827_07290, partial [Rubrobacter sp.]|nr:hypothetical protein [Rubrobacter sp.]
APALTPWREDGRLPQRHLPEEHGLPRRVAGGVPGPGPCRSGPPAWDVAQAAWQIVPLSDDAGCVRHGWLAPPDRALRLRLICDGYGLGDGERAGFSGQLVRRMEITTSGIERLAADGFAVHERLVGMGVPALVRADKAWVACHAGYLDAALVRERGCV